MNYMIH